MRLPVRLLVAIPHSPERLCELWTALDALAEASLPREPLTLEAELAEREARFLHPYGGASA